MRACKFRHNGEAGVEIEHVDVGLAQVGDGECGIERCGDGGRRSEVGPQPEFVRVRGASAAERVDPFTFWDIQCPSMRDRS